MGKMKEQDNPVMFSSNSLSLCVGAQEAALHIENRETTDQLQG